MNIKDNASKIGNGILDISPRNVGKAVVSPFTYIGGAMRRRAQKNKAAFNESFNAALRDSLKETLSEALQASMGAQQPLDVDHVEKKKENDTSPAESTPG